MRLYDFELVHNCVIKPCGVFGVGSITTAAECHHSVSHLYCLCHHRRHWHPTTVRLHRQEEVKQIPITVDQGLALSRHFMFTHQVAAVFCVKWRHGRRLESVTSIKNPTPSLDVYLVKEHSYQISSWSDLKPGTNCYPFIYPRGIEGWVGLSTTSVNNLLNIITGQWSWWVALHHRAALYTSILLHAILHVTSLSR